MRVIWRFCPIQSHMQSAISESPSGRQTLVVVLFTLALFFSSFFAMVTALPLVYYQLRFPRARILSAALPALCVIVIVYLGLVPFLAPAYEKHPQLNWLLSIPFMSLKGTVSASTVSTLGIAYFGYYIFLAMAIVAAFQNPEYFFQNLAIALFATFLCWMALVVFLMYYEAGEDGVAGLLARLIGEAEKTYIEVVKGVEEQNPDLDISVLHTMRALSAEAARMIIFLQPGFLFASLGGLAVFNTVLAKRLFVPLAPKLLLLPLLRFRLPFSFVWMTLALGALFLVNVRFLQREMLQYAIMNLLTGFFFAYTLQGLAIVGMLVESKIQAPLIRLMIYLTIMMFMPPSFIFIALLGFADAWLDMRKIDSPPPSPSKPAQ